MNEAVDMYVSITVAMYIIIPHTQNKEKYICIHPQLVRLVTADNETGDIDVSKYEIRGFPKDYTLKQMAKDVM